MGGKKPPPAWLWGFAGGCFWARIILFVDNSMKFHYIFFQLHIERKSVSFFNTRTKCLFQSWKVFFPFFPLPALSRVP
jgi:hypothetical protein